MLIRSKGLVDKFGRFYNYVERTLADMIYK